MCFSFLTKHLQKIEKQKREACLGNANRAEILDRVAPGRKPQFFNILKTKHSPILSKRCAPDVHAHTHRAQTEGHTHKHIKTHTRAAFTHDPSLQSPTIWVRISVIAAQLAPTHSLYQLCADMAAAIPNQAIPVILAPVTDALQRGYYSTILSRNAPENYAKTC